MFRSRVIQRFKGLELPLVCPSFYKLQTFFGCAWGKCRECYLRGTYFRLCRGNVPRPTIYRGLTWEKIGSEVERFTNTLIEPQMLNAGELADSLSFENGRFFGHSFSELIVPLMERLHKHKVLFLTKLTPSEHNLWDFEDVGYTVLSWTLNEPEVSKMLREPVNVPQRIFCCRTYQGLGYEVRIRIDPIMPGFNYESLVIAILDKFTPARVTLGSLRINNHILPRTDPEFWKLWLPKMTKVSPEKWRFPFEVDVASFGRIIDAFREHGYRGDIALCKEHTGVWQNVGLSWRNCKCNCAL